MATDTNFKVVEQDGTPGGVSRVIIDKDGVAVSKDGGLKVGVTGSEYPVDAFKEVEVKLIATTVSHTVFIAKNSRFVVHSISHVHNVAGGSGATYKIEVATGTDDEDGGTDQMAAATLEGTANTVVNVALTAQTTLNPGDRLNIVMAGTLTALVGHVSITLRRVA